ncbi:MAG: hypothetical protein M0011_10635 [Elusimicrobia bacterium]|nr:hypothetical protein [Elusimicrobiota bacterium]
MRKLFAAVLMTLAVVLGGFAVLTGPLCPAAFAAGSTPDGTGSGDPDGYDDDGGNGGPDDSTDDGGCGGGSDDSGGGSDPDGSGGSGGF